MQTALTGAAGEYYVAAELSRLGWSASITPKGVQRSDVLAQHVETRTVVAIQVKTARAGTNFRLNKKLELPAGEENEWIALVALRESAARAEFYIVPRNVVAAFIYVDHRVWLATPGKGGQPHKDNEQRNIDVSDVAAYRDRWDLLLRPTSEAPCALPDRFYSGVQQHSIALPGEYLPVAIVRTD